MSNGYTGLSFPMQISSRGGLKMSTTSPTDFSHIEESIRQILCTRVGERAMELYFGGAMSSHIFEESDESSYALIKHEIVSALTQFEPRIEVYEDGVELSDFLDEVKGENFLHITIHFRVTKYNRDGSTDVDIRG